MKAFLRTRFSIQRWPAYLLDIFLVALILIGAVYRFAWANWNQDTQLHPDEYGLTNTLTALQMPTSWAEYFNTRLSPMSPYDKYDIAGVKSADGPDNRLRWGQWPMILLRAAAESSGNTSYGDLRLMGRSLSACADFLAVLIIYFIGRQLYSRRVGLIAAALSALAVMEIQQSHFMTVDNFGTLFCALALYAAVRVAQQPIAVPGKDAYASYGFNASSFQWLVLFGISFGMAMATKINLLPVAGMLAVAIFIGAADLKLRSRADLRRILWIALGQLALAAVLSVLVFRVTQPMSFRAVNGDTTIFTWHLNQDWVDSMKVAQMESTGVGGGPPAEQWAARPAILFPLMNMVVWGMGLPLGLMAWFGFGRAAWQVIRTGRAWRSQLLPLVWVGGYFLFMGTRWVKSVRYFLPIYPFLALLAAWALVDVWQRAGSKRGLRIAAGGLAGIVLIGTLVWANAFVNSIYRQDHTRIQATQWIYQNIPAPIMLTLATDDGVERLPIEATEGTALNSLTPLLRTFRPTESGVISAIELPRVSNANSASVHLQVSIYHAQGTETALSTAQIEVQPNAEAPRGSAVTAPLPEFSIEAGETYSLKIESAADTPVILHQTVVANENWDEGLPLPMDGYNPYGGLYTGITIENRWYDDANKRQMFIDSLEQTDYIFLPSQRGIWSVARLQKTYPMTIEYYRALFDGRLGFELVAEFDAPFEIGPLRISDVGGSLAWNEDPPLPLFNFNFFAAEEAFSVYDHPPVWIFKKTAEYDAQHVAEILGAIDLSQVVVESPRDARPVPIQ